MDDRRFWVANWIMVAVAITAAAVPAAIEDLPGSTILLRLGFFLVAGLSALYLVRRWTEGAEAPFNSQGRLERFTKSGAAALLITASVFGVWKTRAAPEPPTPPPVQSAVRQLADQLSNNTWAEEGTSCTTQDIKFVIEGDDLVAYPRGEPSLRYQLFGAHGRQLITRSGASHVFFELRDDGFTVLEEGEVQWFGLCR